jgi:N-acetylmuramoyl-L-alanine amidase|tara:strand:- start:2088 stop:2654 length:567 start_codon:yes stop_codon:yes gene_type:complete
MNKPKSIILCVGHYQKRQGTKNPGTGISEWQINRIFTERLARQLVFCNYKVTVIDNDALTRKVKAINSIMPDIAIDIHCNAFDGNIKGHECLYWHLSGKGKLLANLICDSISFNHNRMSKPVITEAGSYFCRTTRPVSIVLETSFIDNDNDFYPFIWSMFDTAKEVKAGIKFYFRYLEGIPGSINLNS